MEHVGDRVDVERILFLDCPRDLCVERLVERGKTSGRADGNEESIGKRFATYHEETLPVVEHYEGLELLVRVDAGHDVDTVFQGVQQHMADV